MDLSLHSLKRREVEVMRQPKRSAGPPSCDDCQFDSVLAACLVENLADVGPPQV
jgi:hypothetical protein